MQLYDYVKAEPRFTLKSQVTRRYAPHYEVTFHSACPNRYQEKDTACGEYYLPNTGSQFPIAILIHGLGISEERHIAPYRMLARDLSKMGIATFILKLLLPAQAAESRRKRQLSRPYIENWLELFQVLVINTGQIIDWAESRNELDAGRVAVIGISTGGMASTIAMAVDRRITAGVFIITGGNMKKISWSESTEVQLSHNCTKSQCHEVYSHYPQYLADVKEKGIENVVPAKECFLFDPLTFAPYLGGRPKLMINAEQDNYVPKDSTLELWQACGRPRIVWLPTNHQAIFLRYHSIRREITAFLGSAFNMVNDD